MFAADSQGKPVQADLSFGEVDEALYSVRPDTSGDIVSFFYPKRYVYLQPQTSFEFYFSGQAGTKSPLLAELARALPSAHGAGKAGLGPGGAQGAQGISRHGVLESECAHRARRPRACGIQFPRCADDVAHHDSRHDGRRQGRRRGDARAGAQESDRAAGCAALLPPGRRNGAARDCAQLSGSAKDVTFALDVQGVDVISGQTQKIDDPGQGRELRGLAREGAHDRQRRAHGQGADQ